MVGVTRPQRVNFGNYETGTGAFTNSYTYDDYSNRSVATLAGVAASYSYDANNRLLSSSQSNNVTAYTYDDQGNLTNSVLTYNGVEQNSVDYTYDDFNRLAKVRDNSGETVYTYDADGKRSSKTKNGVSEKYIWDGDQLVVTLGTKKVAQFTLSASTGATVRMPKLIAGHLYAVTVKGTTYLATALEVGKESGPPAELFSARARIDPDEPPIPIIPPGVEDTYIRLEAGPVSMEMEVNENPTTDGLTDVHVIGPTSTSIVLYDSDPDRMTASYVRGLSLVAAVKNGVRTYYHYNAHGDVVQLTNSSGTVTKDYTYDAFGVEKSASSTDLNPFRYCGEQYDDETGNYYLRARYYSPAIGRFTQEDPVMDGLNWYTYCAGNPITYRDPSGYVLVGLREYASTYEGATVDWDNDTRTAIVVYGGKTLAVVADSINLISLLYFCENGGVKNV